MKITNNIRIALALCMLSLGTQFLAMDATRKISGCGTVNPEDVDLETMYKYQSPAVIGSPVRYKSSIPQQSFQDLTWISESVSAFKSNFSEEEDVVGYVNFGYYNNPQRLPDLISAINRAIGTVQHNNDYDGYIYELFVENRYRKNGIGTKLLNEAIKKMVAQGCQKIIWQSHPYPFESSKASSVEQEKLNKFYEKRGGRIIDPAETDKPDTYYFVYKPEQK